MTMADFEARIAAFYQINREMVPEISDQWWPSFRDSPLGFFKIAKDREKEAIWQASDKVLVERARAVT